MKNGCGDNYIKYLYEYIEKLEEYIDFLTEQGIKDSMFCIVHGKIDDKETIDLSNKLRLEIKTLKSFLHKI